LAIERGSAKNAPKNIFGIASANFRKRILLVQNGDEKPEERLQKKV
jgi:hypothetical protein